MGWRDRFMTGSVWDLGDGCANDWMAATPGMEVFGRRGHEAVVDSAAAYQYRYPEDDGGPMSMALVWLREGFEVTIVFVNYAESLETGDDSADVRDVREIDATPLPTRHRGRGRDHGRPPGVRGACGLRRRAERGQRGRPARLALPNERLRRRVRARTRHRPARLPRPVRRLRPTKVAFGPTPRR